MTPNQEKFTDAYRAALTECVQNPKYDYRYGVARVPEVAAKMISAVADGSFNHDSPAFKLACKRLGIKSTRTAILTYWRG